MYDGYEEKFGSPAGRGGGGGGIMLRGPIAAKEFEGRIPLADVRDEEEEDEDEICRPPARSIAGKLGGPEESLFAE